MPRLTIGRHSRAALRSRGLLYQRAARNTLVALIAGAGVAFAVVRPFDGYDFGIYRLALDGWPSDIYRCDGGWFRYAPGFLVAFMPFGLLDPAVGLALWRLVSVAALVVSVWGLGPVAVAILLFPAVVSDLAVANVSTIALAAAIAVVRWPSARTVLLYAVLVALIPKPMFIPVLAWGFVKVPAARPGVLLIGAAGAAQLLWPGFIDGLMTGDRIVAAYDVAEYVPRWLVLVSLGMAAALTWLSLRWPRLLGPASVLASPYWYPYVFVPLALSLVPSHPAAQLLPDNEPDRTATAPVKQIGDGRQRAPTDGHVGDEPARPATAGRT